MTRLNPLEWSVRWQLAALLLLTQIFAHVISVVTVDLSTAPTGGGRNALALSLSEPMITALRFATMDPAEMLPRRFADMGRFDPRFRVQETVPDRVLETDRLKDIQTLVLAKLPDVWQSRIALFQIDQTYFLNRPPVELFGVAAQLPNGQWAVFEPQPEGFIQNIPKVVALLALFILAVTLTFLSLWAGAALVAPLQRLSQGVDRFSDNLDAPALIEAGPVEVRHLTASFNEMREKLRTLVADRSQALASIGHDMRTPLTRLRLRCELLAPSEVATAIERDIDVLQNMIDDALSYLRAEGLPMRCEPVDLAVLVATVVQEYADQGHVIGYAGPGRLTVICDHALIRRALENLIGNATKFATETAVVLQATPEGRVRIEIRDNGPGISEPLRQAVLEPFSRVETVRLGAPQTVDGFGLGLTIARDLIARHGGMLTLSDNMPGGLAVLIDLPSRALPATGFGAEPSR